MTRDLTSDPAAEHLSANLLGEDDLASVDALSGGNAARAPRSLAQVELLPDDEALAAEDWDDPESL